MRESNLFLDINCIPMPFTYTLFYQVMAAIKKDQVNTFVPIRTHWNVVYTTVTCQKKGSNMEMAVLGLYSGCCLALNILSIWQPCGQHVNMCRSGVYTNQWNCWKTWLIHEMPFDLRHVQQANQFSYNFFIDVILKRRWRGWMNEWMNGKEQIIIYHNTMKCLLMLYVE